MYTDEKGVQRDYQGIPLGGIYTQDQKLDAGVTAQDSLVSADIKVQAEASRKRMLELAISVPTYPFKARTVWTMVVAGALLTTFVVVYILATTGARQPAERVRLISWAVDGTRDEWSLSNGLQIVAPGDLAPADAALSPTALSQKLLDQTAWDIVGGNPTSEAAKMATRAAAFRCLARDYAGCLKSVSEAASTTEANTREFAKRRSKGGFMMAAHLGATENFLDAAILFLERKALAGPTRAEAVRLKASMCVRAIPFSPEQTLDRCRDSMRAYLRSPETRDVAQSKLDAMSGWRWSWVSARLNAASTQK